MIKLINNNIKNELSSENDMLETADVLFDILRKKAIFSFT
jgi:hypothetical protein